MILRCLLWLLLAGAGLTIVVPTGQARQAVTVFAHSVEPGDTWPALSRRFGADLPVLLAANGRLNPVRQPVIGETIQIPALPGGEQAGRLIRPLSGGWFSLAVRLGANPWRLAWRHGHGSPYRPVLQQLVFQPGLEAVPREYPPGLTDLSLSWPLLLPGQAFGFRARASADFRLEAWYGDRSLMTFRAGDFLVGLGATGAFHSPGVYELSLQPAGAGRWAQPWPMATGSWAYQDLTLTGSAAAISGADIAAERERLAALWSQVSSAPLWTGPMTLPLQEFLDFSSAYGVRRSYNGGGYNSYHEGVDFSALGGTPVYAPADGRVALAETLAVRGGAVIIDHGLGVYSGYYHLSAITAEAGQMVAAGTAIGAVGTTGLSTGNHLHWDLLVNGVWVDALAWQQQDMNCWLLAGLGRPCAGSSSGEGAPP